MVHSGLTSWTGSGKSCAMKSSKESSFMNFFASSVPLGAALAFHGAVTLCTEQR